MTYILDNTDPHARHVFSLRGERDVCDMHTGHGSEA